MWSVQNLPYQTGKLTRWAFQWCMVRIQKTQLFQRTRRENRGQVSVLRAARGVQRAKSWFSDPIQREFLSTFALYCIYTSELSICISCCSWYTEFTVAWSKCWLNCELYPAFHPTASFLTVGRKLCKFLCDLAVSFLTVPKSLEALYSTSTVYMLY